MRGTALAALDSNSLAVVTNDRKIFISDGLKNFVFVPKLIEKSSILNATSAKFVNGLISNYSSAILCYRASEHGFKAASFHSRCDKMGPSITIVKSSYNKTFGGFTTYSWTS